MATGNGEVHDLNSLFSSEGRDFLIRNNGEQVPVSELVGKHVLIYFSAHWCPPCRGFTPKLIETYKQLKANGCALEIIFVSSDRNQASFNEYFSDMPWLALPYGDEKKSSLSRMFDVRGIPFLVAIGPDGKTITTQTRHLIAAYGADGFPFTEEHIQSLKGST